MKRAKQIWNIVTLGALMALLNVACHKDPTPEPQPNPNQPTDTITPNDTITPIIPTKEIVLDWNWEANLGWAPPKDSIKYYTDQDSVKFVDINIIGDQGVGFPANCTGYHAGAFHKARDTLQTRIDIDPAKVKLSGTILVNSTNGANLPSHDSSYYYEPGMAIYDSLWFTGNGCLVRRPIYSK